MKILKTKAAVTRHINEILEHESRLKSRIAGSKAIYKGVEFDVFTQYGFINLVIRIKGGGNNISRAEFFRIVNSK